MDCFHLAEAISQQHENVMRVMKYAIQPPHLLQSKYNLFICMLQLCYRIFPVL